MAQKIYGIKLEQDSIEGLSSSNMLDLSEERKRQLIEKYGLFDDEMYTLDSFLYYLNSDGIDTENYYYFVY